MLGARACTSLQLDDAAVAGLCPAGVMGRSTGEMLAGMGYKVQAWARSEKQHPVSWPSLTCCCR